MAAVPESEWSLVIPAYNEAQRIGELLDQLQDFSGEVIFVCDGTDATGEIIDSFEASHTGLRLRCIHARHRLGKGGAVIAGMQAATGRYVGYMDADGSTPLDQMRLLYAALETCDGAIGSRWVEGAVLVRPQGWLRRIESRAFNLLVRILFSLTYNDTQCGAKAFHSSAVREVASMVRITGFAFDVELLWRLRQRGFTIQEVPIAWRNNESSKVDGSDALKMLASLVRIRFG